MRFDAVLVVVAGGLVALAIGTGHVGFAVMAVLVVFVAKRAQAEARALEAGFPRSSAVLIAVVCPDQAESLADVLPAIAATDREVIVLAVDAAASDGPPADAIVRSERVRQALPPLVRAAFERHVRARGKPITLLTAAGGAPATTALEIARRLRVKRLVVVAERGASFMEQQTRALATWRALPAPKASLEVQLFEADAPAERRHLFVLAAS